MIILRIDNTTAIAHVNRCGGTKSEHLNDLSRQICSFVEERDLDVRAEHIPGSLNVRADDLSRKLKDASNWMLDHDVVRSLEDFWGPFSIDLFADRLNCHVNRFISWRPDPEALSVDAFLWPWNSERLCYAFPPFTFIGKVLSKLCAEKAELVLVAPMWTAQAWFPLLLSRLVDYPVLLPNFPALLLDAQQRPHPLVLDRSLHLMAWRLSGDDSSVKEFHRRLPTSVCKLGVKALRHIMLAPGENGFCGLVNGALIPFRRMSLNC